MKNRLYIILIFCLMSCQVHYLNLNKLDADYTHEEIFGTYYSGENRLTSGQFILKTSSQYSFIFSNCGGKGQENGKIIIEGRKILFIADSSFSIDWPSIINKSEDTNWKPCDFKRNYLYLNGGLHNSNGDKYYKEFEYHR